MQPITHRIKDRQVSEAAEALGLSYFQFSHAEMRAFIAIDRSAALHEEELRKAGYPAERCALANPNDLPF